MLYNYFIYFFLMQCIFTFKNKIVVKNKLNKKIFMKPTDMINYITSIKDYTIISTNDKNKNLQENMINNNMNAYYVNINNIFDKDEILNILNQKYGEHNLWIFYKGSFIGSKLN